MKPTDFVARGLDKAWRTPFLSSRCGFLPVCIKPRIDESNYGVEHRAAHAFLPCNKLHKSVGAFDVRRAIVKRARGRGWTRQTFGCKSIFFEWLKFVAYGSR